MNLIVGLVILLVLACSEFRHGGPAGELPLRVLLIGLTTALVPGLAMVQTALVSARIRQAPHRQLDQAGMIRRLTASHTAVWLAASLAMIVTFRWHDIVRENWGLGQAVLLDDLLILLPILLSLVASWAVFYEIQQQLSENSTGARRTPVTRLQFVRLRVQLHLLVVALPILLAVLIQDTSSWWQATSWAAQLGLTATILAGLLAYPRLLQWFWTTTELPDRLHNSLIGTQDEFHLDCQPPRCWLTGGQLINACVIGLTRGSRRILISERLLALFPDHEIAAIIRHEIGHLKRHHGWWRILFSLLPLLGVLVSSWLVAGSWQPIEAICARWSIPAWWGWTAFSGCYAMYLLLAIGWLSHGMEREADLFSGCELASGASSAGLRFSGGRLHESASALLRLAACHPQSFERSSWWHPSLASRIEALNRVDVSTDPMTCFDEYRDQRILVASVVSLVVVTASISLMV